MIPNADRRFYAIDPWHAHVHPDEMRTPGRKLVNRILAILGHFNLKARALQNALEQDPVFLFIFDDQDAVIGLTRCKSQDPSAPNFGSYSRGFFDFLNGQLNPENGSAAERALQAQAAFHQVYERVCDGQP